MAAELPGLGRLARRPRATRLDGGDRGGGDAARPRDWCLAHVIDDLLPELSGRAWPRSVSGRDARLHARARHRGALHRGRRRRRAGQPARHARWTNCAARPRAPRRRAPTRFAVGEDTEVSGERALPGTGGRPARARPPRADVRAARARGRADRRAGGGRCGSPARPPAAAPRPVGQLALLARAWTPGSPRCARRCSRRSRGRACRATSRATRATSRPSTRFCAPTLPRAHLPVVGRAPAAALRHCRGAHHGRSDDRGGGGGAGRADTDAGARSSPPSVSRRTNCSTPRRCSRRTASSRCAMR